MGIFKPPNVEELKAKHDIDKLIKALNYKKDKQIQIDAAIALGELPYYPYKKTEALIKKMKDDDNRIRKCAALALGKIGDSSSVEPLITAFKDKNSDVRLSAAYALSLIKDIEAFEAIIINALESVDKKFQETAAFAFSWYVARISRTEPNYEFSEARIATAHDLIQQHTRGALNILFDALKDEDKVVRVDAIYALESIGGDLVVEPIITALKDEDKEVRKTAAHALAGIGGVLAVEPFKAALKDEDKEVRKIAAYALGEIGDEDAVKPLKSALKDKDKDVRQAATSALEKITPKPHAFEKITPKPEKSGPSKASLAIFSRLPISLRLCPECMRSRGIQSIYKVIGESPVSDEAIILECPICGHKNVYINK